MPLDLVIVVTWVSGVNDFGEDTLDITLPVKVVVAVVVAALVMVEAVFAKVNVGLLYW